MAPYENVALAQGKKVRDRVLANTSARTGHLEDQRLDLDARTMAIMGKRQRLNVRLTLYPPAMWDHFSNSHLPAELWNDFTSRILDDFNRILGIFRMAWRQTQTASWT